MFTLRQVTRGAGAACQRYESIETGYLGVRNVCDLIDKAIPSLAFTNPSFAKRLISNFAGEQRKQVVEALAYQAHRFGRGGGVFAGSPEEHLAQRQTQFSDNVAAFPDDPELSDLAQAMRRFT